MTHGALRGLLGIIMLAAVVWVLAVQMSWQEIAEQLTSLDGYALGLLALLVVVTRLPQAESLRRALPQATTRLSFCDSFWNISLKALFNQVFSGAGLVAQGARLRLTYDIPVSAFAAATWRQWVAQMLAIGALGIIAATLVSSHSVDLALTALLGFTALLTAGIVLWFAPRSMKYLPLNERLMPKAPLGTNSNRSMSVLIVLQLFVAGLRLARLGIILFYLSPDLDAATGFFAFMLGEFVLVFPVTPGGIGFRELLLGVGAIGSASQQLMLAGLVDRAMALLVTVTLGAGAMFAGRRSRREFSNPGA